MTAERRHRSHCNDSHMLPRAFLTFVRDAQPLLHTFFSSNGADATDTEDLVQDCLERLMRYHRCGTDELYLLLHRISRNRLADFHKSMRAHIERQIAPVDATLEDRSPHADPIRQASATQMLKLFFRAMSALPDCPREVYLLNRVVGMSYSQIARHRRVTPKTVEKQMSRALQELRVALAPTSFWTENTHFHSKTNRGDEKLHPS